PPRAGDVILSCHLCHGVFPLQSILPSGERGVSVVIKCQIRVQNIQKELGRRLPSATKTALLLLLCPPPHPPTSKPLECTLPTPGGGDAAISPSYFLPLSPTSQTKMERSKAFGAWKTHDKNETRGGSYSLLDEDGGGGDIQAEIHDCFFSRSFIGNGCFTLMQSYPKYPHRGDRQANKNKKKEPPKLESKNTGREKGGGRAVNVSSLPL
ncbi:unnamed protein product, partial [Ectocarpus sp. 8 AP-2014]